MTKEEIENLKKLMADWNKLGDKYTVMSKNTDDSEEILLFREKAHDNYKSAKLLRECLLKCGVDLEE